MRKLLITLAGLTTSTMSAGAPSLTPGLIRMDIHRSGAKAVVDRLLSSGTYEVVMSKMKAGHADWVLLAKPLSAGSDAASSEELQQALIYALPKSPKAVLSVVDITGSSVPRSVENVCSASFFEGDRTDISAYRAAAIRAVEDVDVPALRLVKKTCLRRLAKREAR